VVYWLQASCPADPTSDRERIDWNERSIRLLARCTQAVPRNGNDDGETRITSTTLEQEIRKGRVGHNPSVEGGIVVMTEAGQLKMGNYSGAAGSLSTATGEHRMCRWSASAT
jgi:hypothetical protein